MASQLDSLSFVNEGSTKRKEVLAKFLDLEIFDKKFRYAKEDSATTKANLKRLEGVDFPEEILSIKSKITKSELGIESNRARCESIRFDIKALEQSVASIDSMINAVPGEIIDPVVTSREIEKKKAKILSATESRARALLTLNSSESDFEKVSAFLEKFDASSYQEKKEKIQENMAEIKKLEASIKDAQHTIASSRTKEDLLREVPCGTDYPSCRFIRDAHAASQLVQVIEPQLDVLRTTAAAVKEESAALNPRLVDDHLEKYYMLVEKRNNLATNIATSKLQLEKSDSILFREQVALESLQDRTREYEENKEAIENLKGLLQDKDDAAARIDVLQSSLLGCEQNIMALHKTHGALEQELKHCSEMSKEYESLKNDFAAYDLLMTCYHPNGIAYDIVKERLPIINQEIAKILTNIVEFEIFIQNDDKKLDVFIKHPQHGPRPLEMGSGAEKTIASMAIRLAFLTVSSLPKSDLFILDEPGTALDEENMEGFVRILDMVKGYFKTVILISHLDSLKDCVDMQINIEKKSGYAQVLI